MKILFLDQTGQLGGAEISLKSVVDMYRDTSRVILFEDGPYRHSLEDYGISVQVIAGSLEHIRKQSNCWDILGSLGAVGSLVGKLVPIAQQYELIYANTQKALAVGALVSALTGRPLVYHLRDILSVQHFSRSNIQILIALANQYAHRVIANSQATRQAFIEAGGDPARCGVVYNGFDPGVYRMEAEVGAQLRGTWGWGDRYVVGCFSRLSPWKGQEVLLRAIAKLPEPVCAVLVGAALFQEHEYVRSLHQLVKSLGLNERVKFLGFRADVPQVMGACNLIAHTSTAAEPFGRVIVEGMLCDRPVVATAAGGALELIESGRTGWLISPNASDELARAIALNADNQEISAQVAQAGQRFARQQFQMERMHAAIDEVLLGVLSRV